MNVSIKLKLLIFFTSTLSLISCQNESKIEGQWVIKSATVGNEKMTPDARWVRFHSDFTQESGNGWLQHSFGTYNFDKDTGSLTIINTNGIHDSNEPFKVEIDNKSMTLNRIQDGQMVEVILEQAQKLPMTHGDELFGLWKLNEAIGSGPYFKDPDRIIDSDYIFFRWDKRFVISSGTVNINGVYNVHGHKPEVELIPYGAHLQRNFWNMKINKDTITLQLLNTDSTVTRTFKRIHEFPGS
ncbi:hypothetical protein [Zhouia amylolytica]|uniref:Lipocalin-like domain-containing protein n=1 Tax=Zhouia amylolytica AD3 TaxID=1286632 RepID=W2UTF5_9FLAO|nr:hypothetical protein [Zhouia amylolytica]ETN96627.1 hypothetical protein P278_00530 [Zhouia amylolytica AD3]